MSVISFKCPNCDGELVFEPSTQKYECPYCGSDFHRIRWMRCIRRNSRPGNPGRLILMGRKRRGAGKRGRRTEWGSGSLYLPQLWSRNYHRRDDGGYFLLLLSQSGGIIWKIVREIPSRLDSAFFHRQEESRTDFSGCNEKEKIRTERIF